jgi:FecR protein
MKEIKVWPHLTVVAVVCALIAGLAVGFWIKRRNETASAESVLTAGRIQKIDGDVAVGNALTSNEETEWSTAAANAPFSVGDRIYTGDNSQASLAFSGRNFARLHPNTSLDVLSLDRQRTQLALRDGSAIFDVGYLDPGQVFEVATPYGAVDFDQPGLYNVGIGDNGNVIVSVLSGLAQVVGLGGSGQISKGEVLTLLGQTAAEIVLSRIDGRDAGYLVDDYYQYQYPQYYDGRYSDYNAYLDNPYYFDPYRRNVSYQYASPYIPGLNDLDYYGNWQNVSGYGYGWSPRVETGWSPYQQGYWMNDYPYGPTWVSSEPWGYAPYHYGRWAFVGDRWYWIPDGVNTSPQYSPALVAFIPSQNEIGWVPLAPSDPYVARYYDQNWNPYYLTRQDNFQSHVVNLGVPGAVAVLPIDDFVRGYDDRRIRKWDRRNFDGTRAVLDPLTMTPLRNAVIHSAWGRGKKDLPPGIAKKLDATQVVVSRTPVAPPFRRDFPRRLAVATAPERAKDKQFKVRDERPNKQLGRAVREDQRNDGNVKVEKPMRQELKRSNQIERHQRFEQPNRGQLRRAEGVRVANPAVERKTQPVRPVRNAREPRRIERPASRPEKHQERRNVSAQPIRQSGPPAVQRSVQRHGPPARVQQQQQARPQRGGSPAQVEQKQQGAAKRGGPPAAPSTGGGGKSKGKGKG